MRVLSIIILTLLALTLKAQEIREIISDSHHDLSAIDDAICLADDVDCWLHAGDSIDDAGYLADVSKKPVYAVPGNIDWFSTKPKEISRDKVISVGS